MPPKRKKQHLAADADKDVEIKRLKAELKIRDEKLKIQDEKSKIRDEKSKIRDEKLEIFEGTYFSRISQVWSPCPKTCTRKNWSNLQRQSPPSFHARYPANVDVYGPTKDEAGVSGNVTQDEVTKSSNSMTTTARSNVFPTNIFGTPDTSSHVAHLIPASPAHAAVYADVVRWVLGYDDRTPPATLQKAIHGSRLRTGNNNNNNRIPHTGLKHAVPNKIRLNGQGLFFDKNPCVLITPICTLEDMKVWDGKGYEAIVMIDTFGDQGNITTICSGLGFNVMGDTATPEEIEKARKTLEEVLLGMRFSLLEKLETLITDKEKYREELDCLKKNFTVIDGNAHSVLIPTKISTTTTVRKIKFNGKDDATDGHPAPDPMILASRAAVTWSWRNRQKLLASGPEAGEDDSASERSIAAEEAWWQWKTAHCLRIPESISVPNDPKVHERI